MSNFKELKTNPDFSVSLIDALSFVTKTNKTKYLELFSKLYKSKVGKYNKKEIKDFFIINFEIESSEVDKLSTMTQFYYFMMLDGISEELKTCKNFIKLNERNLIEKNDVTRYSSFDELKTEVSKAESRFIEKEMEKQVYKVFDDSEWLLLRPLTFESSCKYGSDTKWCTTFHDRSYFDRYTRDGILIYIINKQTGIKVACYRSLNVKNHEFSFWNQVDKRIDSMESGLPESIKEKILDEIRLNGSSNLVIYQKKHNIISSNKILEEDYQIPPRRGVQNNIIPLSRRILARIVRHDEIEREQIINEQESELNESLNNIESNISSLIGETIDNEIVSFNREMSLREDYFDQSLVAEPEEIVEESNFPPIMGVLNDDLQRG